MSCSSERWSARAYDLHILTVLFGTAAMVRAQAVVSAKAGALMRAWLNVVEALVRRTLLFDALDLIRALTKRARRAAKAQTAPAKAKERAAGFVLTPPAP